MKLNLQTPLAVVCHDAGSANLIFSWLKHWEGTVHPVMQGPAALIWESIFIDIPLEFDLISALAKSKMLLSGTSWRSCLEHQARLFAAHENIYSVAVIDHWVNYEHRFEREDTCQLPDEIWVTDKYSFEIANCKFPSIPVVLQHDTYVQEQIKLITPPPRKNILLYMLEPVASNWGTLRAGEFVALDYLINRLLVQDSKPILRLRLHPSEPLNKYDHYIEQYEFIELDTSKNVGAAISTADAVIGVESFALTIALSANRPVFSSLPPNAPHLRLPHKGIIQIRNFPNLTLNFI